MARGRVRTVVNVREVRRLQERNAAGMADLGEEILKTVRVPDAPPIGQGLIETGGYVVLRKGNAVHGDAEPPPGTSSDGAELVVGFGFPGRFLEGGTIKMAPQPFLTPAVQEVLPRKVEILRRAHRRGA